jgi:VWFA-related protein
MQHRLFPTSHRIVLPLMAVFCSTLAVAQKTETPASDQPVTTMSVKVKVVNVLATVRDRHGTVIANLSKDAFTLTEDGRSQNIRYFAQESDLPLTLGLLVDTSLSQRRVLDQERSASHSFLNRMVREDRDRAFIIHFDHEVELLQDLTSSHEKLEAALDNLETPRLERASTNDPSSSDPGTGRRGGRGGGFHSGGTMLYDAVYLASDELMKKQQGRKALIILSDGVDTGSKETLEYAMETAQRSDTVVYSILFKDDQQGGGGLRGPRIGGGIGGIGGGMGRGRGGRAAIRGRGWMERKFWSRSQRKREDECSRFPRKTQLTRSTPRSRTSCGINITLGTPRTELARPKAVITRSRLQ